MITDPTAVFVYLAGVLGVVYWLSELQPLRRVFGLAPAIIWAYFIPMLSTTAGITPVESPTYDWMVRYLLPVSLFLLMVTGLCLITNVIAPFIVAGLIVTALEVRSLFVQA